MIPIGGTYTINPKQAMDIIEELEPLIVLPMHYKTDKHNASFNDLATLNDFLALNGAKVETMDELVIKDKSNIPNTLTVINLAF